MIIHGDCLEKLKEIPDDSVDSLVTDPPYGWRFMGKAWDGADIEQHAAWAGKKEGNASAAGKYSQTHEANLSFQAWTESWAREAFRVLKPGAHALIFCGPRTYHRMASGVEDAGFEVRDQIQWLFGSGFPKSLDVSKAIDKAAGAEREVVGVKPRQGFSPTNTGCYQLNSNDNLQEKTDAIITAPSTDAAKTWAGWGTALKPANEPILLARKPPEEKTVAANVLKYGTGGINIDASRVEGSKPQTIQGGRSISGSQIGNNFEKESRRVVSDNTQGRFPANLILNEEAAAMLDAQSGFSKTCRTTWKKKESLSGNGQTMGKMESIEIVRPLDDSGGASRFFYCAKASKSERNAGLEGLTNGHPTVKPQRLMQYLIRMITPPGGTVLDPFMGSGSTLVAAQTLGFKFIGIEQDEEYVKIAERRIEATGALFTRVV